MGEQSKAKCRQVAAELVVFAYEQEYGKGNVAFTKDDVEAELYRLEKGGQKDE